MKSDTIEEVRKFNRFYTNLLGLLDRHLLRSAFSLPEARALYELSRHSGASAKEIGESLKMDKGYLSRILSEFERKGLLARMKSKSDGRASKLSLTAKGKSEFRKIN